jgi:hypothetical protein
VQPPDRGVILAARDQNLALGFLERRRSHSDFIEKAAIEGIISFRFRLDAVGIIVYGI